MKIILEKEENQLGGDLFAISYLLNLLDKDKGSTLNSQILHKLWIRYLEDLSNQFIDKMWNIEDLPTHFDLPFEADFGREHQKLKSY